MYVVLNLDKVTVMFIDILLSSHSFYGAQGFSDNLD